MNNFNVIAKHLIESQKPLKMFLFLMSREIPDSEIAFVVIDLPKESDLTPLDGYIEEREDQVIGEFTKNQIKIIYLDEILKKFETEGNYDGMINQMKVIFNKKEMNPFENESFLWGSF